MARIVTRANGLREIRFDDKNGKSRTVYVGRMPKRDAESVGVKIDHLVSRQIMGAEPDSVVSQWVADLPDKLHAKLVKFGLAAERISEADDPMPTLRTFTDQYVADHPGKDGTKEQLEITARSLCKKFGGETPMDQITAGDAEAYRKWLETTGNERRGYSCGLAKNTVRRRIGRSKQFFGYAVKLKLIAENPFADEISATTGNEDRLVMVPAEWIETIIRQTDCEDWKIILALARYGGLRSHECRIQRWDDIDIPNRKMLIRSNKTPAVRVCPIFPELLPHVVRAREMAESGSEFVQNRYRHDDNILRELVRMIERAKLVPWTKPMQNLRATRETELAARFPLTDVTSWLGNSPIVAGKHYLMTQEDSFQRAASEGASIAGITSGVKPNPHQNPHQTVHSGGSQQITQEPRTPQNTGDDIQGALATLAVHLSNYPARTRTLND
ncbi:MAG: phage integrase SAM-like domain-containing protein [Rubripirellula sp.]|nr:phage integrase SAM-like domain-containing protein [Rubripirellula sp.]